MKIDRLIYIRDRLDRADEHVETIKGHLIAYYDEGFNGLRGEVKSDGNAVLIHGLPEQRVPPRIQTLVGELLHDLRSSLDHLAWALVEEDGGSPTKDTGFPIMRTANTANKHGVTPPPTVVGGVSPDALAVVDAAQPYQWGTDFARHPLWVLHKLWNIDKHCHVACRGTLVKGFVIPYSPGTFQTRIIDCSEDGAEVLFAPDGPAVNVNARATIEVMLCEPQLIIERPLWGTLKGVRDATRLIVSQVEANCF